MDKPALSLTEHQRRILRSMLTGSKLVKSGEGKWEIGNPPTRVRSDTIDKLLRKGAIRLGVGHCSPTNAGAEAVGHMTLDMAIRAVADRAPNEFARQYADNAMRAADEGGTHGLGAQIRYILANLRNWRGEEAKAVRSAMKTWLDGRGKR